jgi:hypothetical protein
MAESLRKQGERVISSTTTKVRRAEAEGYPGLVLLDSRTPDVKALKDALHGTGNVFVGEIP